MTAKPDTRMLGPAPRFSPVQRRELQDMDGLTSAQLVVLERALRDLAFELQPSARTSDVRDVLGRLHLLLADAEKMVNRMETSRRPSPWAEAFGHLQLAVAQARRGSDSFSEVERQDWQLTDAVRRSAEVAAQAKFYAPRSRRAPQTASWRAVETIVEALHRPDDEASRAAAGRLSVSRSVARPDAPSFFHVAEVCFQAATGRANANPDRSIRAYLKRMSARR